MPAQLEAARRLRRVFGVRSAAAYLNICGYSLDFTLSFIRRSA